MIYSDSIKIFVWAVYQNIYLYYSLFSKIIYIILENNIYYKMASKRITRSVVRKELEEDEKKVDCNGDINMVNILNCIRDTINYL